MMKNLINKMNQKKRRGFTLIELIIVIAIIAILAAVALPKFAEIRENANVKADISNAKSIQNEVIALISDDKIVTTASSTVYNLTDSPSGDEQKIIDGMQNKPKLKASKAKNNNILVQVDDKGNVAIYYDSADSIDATKRIYPDGASPYDGK